MTFAAVAGHRGKRVHAVHDAYVGNVAVATDDQLEKDGCATARRRRVGHFAGVQASGRLDGRCLRDRSARQEGEAKEQACDASGGLPGHRRANVNPRRLPPDGPRRGTPVTAYNARRETRR